MVAVEPNRGGSVLAIPEGGAVRLNLGAGRTRLEGWTSVDLEGDPDIVSDIRKLELPDDYADEIMLIHVVEHLYHWDVLPALKEWRRVLKPGGLLILELPNLLRCCEAVLAGASDRMGLLGIYGDPNYGNPLMTHKFGYSPQSMGNLLREAGFSKVKHRTVQFHKPARDMRLEARA